MELPPEILGIVMEYLSHDATALRSALLVNKTWAVEAIRVLWEKPRVASLAAIGEDRRQFYARQVRELNFQMEDGAKHSTFRNLEFPRLRNLSIGSFRPNTGGKLWLGQYIQSSLREFSINRTEPAEDILHLLGKRCPQLQNISIDSHFEGLTSDRLIRFFDSCKSLTSICLPSDMRDTIDNRLLACLARHDNLEELNLGTFLTYEMLENIFEGIERPFRNIWFLMVEMESKAVPLLAAGIRPVCVIGLTIRDSRVNPLPYFSSLLNLQEIVIYSKEQGEWTGTDFLALKNLRNLRILHIDSWSDLITSPTLTDRKFIAIFKNMSQLQELNFQVQCALSTASITSLGKHCPRLRTCDILGSYDLRSWRSIAMPLFPHLRRLSFSAAIYEEQVSPSSSLSQKAATVAGLIVQHAPKLQGLFLDDRDEFSGRVMAAFNERIRNGYNP